MDTTNFIMGFLAALLLVFVTLSGFYYYFKRTRWRESNIRGYLDLIPDLTREQREQVEEIRKTFLPKVADIRHNLCLKRAELARELFLEPADMARIFEVAETILKYQSELEHQVIEHIMEEKEILSRSQRANFYRIIIEQFASGSLGVHDLKGRR